MNSRKIAWTLVGGAAAVTVSGLVTAVPVLAVGSVVLGGCSMVEALQTLTQSRRKTVSAMLLEQLR